MPDQLDAVAQVIYAVARRADYVDFGPWEELPDSGRDFARKQARAAIDALGLTEEWRAIGWMPVASDEAWARRQNEHTGNGVETRLVGPWVRAEDGHE